MSTLCFVQLAVTTPRRPSALEETRAKECAARYALLYGPRNDSSLEEVRESLSVEALLVLSKDASELVFDGTTHRFFPGMAPLRLKWLRRGTKGETVPQTRQDPFLEACGFEPGDRVLDATLGLGADALVAAEAVGSSGEVWALESAPALAAWVDEGLRCYRDPAAARVFVKAVRHEEFLAAQPSRSFDVVLFDPMFRFARPGPGPFEVVRRLADPRPLSAATLADAGWVARRWVVVKDGAPGWDLARLGLVPLPSARGAHRYYARLLAL